MADSYKDIIITPNRSNTADPKIDLRGGNSSVNTAITLTVYPDSNGTISFDGSAGQLFSITNDLSGLLWSVNDVSGIPSAEIYANGSVRFAEFSGNVSIGTATNSSKLFVNGNTTVNASINVTSTAALGNTTITGFANVSTTLAAGNTTITGFINVSSAANLNSLTVQNAVITANLEVTDTATINTNSIVVGNTTVNSTYGTSEIKVANSTNSVTITAAQVSVGANVYANTTAVDVGNTIITTTNLTLGGTVTANGSTGTAGQVLISSGASANAYWSGFNTGPAFSAYPNSSIQQTITSGSQQKVLFQVEEYDTNNNFASSRFTPTVAGYYQLNTVVRMSGTMGTGESMIVIWKNGSEYKRGWNASGTEVGANFFAMGVSTLAYANGAGDYFEVYVQQGSGGNRDVTVAGGNITWFNGSLVRSG